MPVAQTLQFRTDFWNRCHQLLKVHRVRPEVASSFFRDNVDRALCHLESHLVVGHALHWIRLVKPTPVETVAELELLWWTYRFEAELEGTSPSSLMDLQPDQAPLCPLLMDKVECTLPYPKLEHHYSEPFLGKVAEWINRDLDSQDIIGATKLSAMFNQKSLDLALILFLIQVLEKATDLNQAGEMLAEIVPLNDKILEWKDKQSLIDYVDEYLQHGHAIWYYLISICFKTWLALVTESFSFYCATANVYPSVIKWLSRWISNTTT